MQHLEQLWLGSCLSGTLEEIPVEPGPAPTCCLASGRSQRSGVEQECRLQASTNRNLQESLDGTFVPSYQRLSRDRVYLVTCD